MQTFTDSVLEPELDTPQSQVKGGWLLLVCHFLDALQTLKYICKRNSYIHIHDSRSKVLNKNFNLGGTQPTLLYDFTFSLCGVAQGNPAKHKLGARFAQGWRKRFHVLS